MTEWAIETEKLSKVFYRKAPQEGKNNAGTPGGSATPRRGWWPLGSRPHSPKNVPFNAVHDVDLRIRQGEIFGLLGPNGAGKTTTIRMLCTLLEPTSGTAKVNGYDVVRQSNQVRQSLGTVLAGERSIYWKLSGRENLEYYAAIYHVPPAVARKRIDELLERMELAGRANDLVEKYSTGMKQRIAISKALLARPPIILLDEPTLGLDPQAARNLREIILQLKQEGHTILLTTHYMEEADQLSDRIGIIDQGTIIALDTPAALKRRINQNDVIRLEVSGWHAEHSDVLKKLAGVESLVANYQGSDSLWDVNLHVANSRAVLPGIIDTLNTNGTHLVNMNIVQPSLEDVFIQLTGKALRD